MKLSFKLNETGSLQFFQLLRYTLTVLTGILFTKAGLPLAELGIYELLIFMTGALSFFWVSGIMNSLMMLFPKTDTHERPALLFNAFILLLILSLAIFVLMRLMSGFIPDLFGMQGGGRIL